MNLELRIFRKELSLNPYRVSKLRSWSNNDANNSLDRYVLIDGNEILFDSPVQTVSNCEGIVPGASYQDTIAPGEFELVLFQAQRKFNCPVHGIRRTKTIGGDYIGDDFCTINSTDRWLNHDWQKLKPQSPGIDCRVAWSAGCLILPTKRFAELNGIFVKLGLRSGFIIKGNLYMEGI